MIKTVLGVAAAATIAIVSFSAPASAAPYHRGHGHDFRHSRAFVHHPVCTTRTIVNHGRYGRTTVRKVRVCR